MKREEFKKFCENRVIFLDGATGTNLMKAGMPAGVCPEAWILEHRQVMIDLQSEYAKAGSNIVYAPTFTGNRIKLADYGLADKIQEINTELVKLTKEAVGENVLVAGDITMTGRQLKPIGDLDFEELIDVYKEQIQILEEAGCDVLVVETMMSLQECRAALIAAKEVSDLPVMVTLTFEADGRTLYGSDAMASAITLEALGASAIGANCSTGPDKMEEIIRNMASVTRIPVIAKPNAGLPSVDENGNTEYDMDCDTFCAEMERLVKAGASIIGGCCGTTPAYIKALNEKYGSLNPSKITDAEGNVIETAKIEEPEPEPEKKKFNPIFAYIGAGVLFFGIVFYFKIIRKKKKKDNFVEDEKAEDEAEGDSDDEILIGGDPLENDNSEGFFDESEE